MTYDRMKAVIVSGEHCYFCGREHLPLVKMKCCERWSCCDTEFISLHGGGYCQFEHEHNSICHFHYNEKHLGKWQSCEECSEFFGKIQFGREVMTSKKIFNDE
jgi:hypothetical protein